MNSTARPGASRAALTACSWAAGDVGDNMGGAQSSRGVQASQASSATQQAVPAKASWRQARPPKDAKLKQEESDPDLKAGAAYLAGLWALIILPL